MRTVLSCRHKHGRVGQAYRGCRTMSHPRSCSPAKTGSTLSATSVGVDIAIPMIGRTTVLLWEVTPSTARMMMLSLLLCHPEREFAV